MQQQNDEEKKPDIGESDIGESRVTIGYTAKLDEVPHEAARLLEDISMHLDAARMMTAQAARTFDVTTGEIDFMTSYEELARCKNVIDRTGRRLHEVLLILSGFFRHKTGHTQIEEEPVTPDDVDPFEIYDDGYEEYETSSDLDDEFDGPEEPVETMVEEVDDQDD